MTRHTWLRPIVAAVVVAFCMFVVAPPAHGGWTDNSGKLPGIGGIGTAILIGALAGGGLVLYTRLATSKPRDIKASPARLDLHGGSAIGQVTLHNNSKREAMIVSLTLAGGDRFRLQPPSPGLPLRLGPRESLTVDVELTPGAAGRFADALVVTTRDDNSAKTRQLHVRIRGTAIAADVAAASAGR